jgi:hypothetical protein
MGGTIRPEPNPQSFRVELVERPSYIATAPFALSRGRFNRMFFCRSSSSSDTSKSTLAVQVAGAERTSTTSAGSPYRPKRDLAPAQIDRLREQYGDSPSPTAPPAITTSPAKQDEEGRFNAPPSVQPPSTLLMPGKGDVPPLQPKSGSSASAPAEEPTGDVDVMDSDVLVEYAPDRRLGMGGYAVVWRATEQKSGRAVVIKKILDAFTNDTDAQRVFREIM